MLILPGKSVKSVVILVSFCTVPGKVSSLLISHGCSLRLGWDSSVFGKSQVSKPCDFFACTLRLLYSLNDEVGHHRRLAPPPCVQACMLILPPVKAMVAYVHFPPYSIPVECHSKRCTFQWNAAIGNVPSIPAATLSSPLACCVERLKAPLW